MFSDPTEQAEAVSVPLVYGLVEAILIGLYCIWAWKAGWTKAPADEKLCVVMIKTYEVHDSDSEDDDEMVEFDPQVVENLSWWQRCFVPKYPDNPTEDDRVSESSIPTPTQQKGIVVEDRVEETRCRFNSEDVTVSTNLTTPPGTPDIPKNPPLYRILIIVSEESKEYDEEVCAQEEYKEDIFRRELAIGTTSL
eukprot:CAMPEP_0171012736 /NCGR_PEP_ID=MMETSP0736-20130129/23820_1 /TAXON_ID=186038 /ORGANISM="Fragilariopsis kerguelensis, Strain L26-C5" /LENGTH=193 /DNA_ID=CAMNT_0011446049 /DNA_START=469 /DNA_END=1051 /DNA_ORIENTATION=+